MKARIYMKVTIFLFLFLTMTMERTNGYLFILDEKFDWKKPYKFCGRSLPRAVNQVCHLGNYSSVSEDFRLSKYSIADYCCTYNCTYQSLRIYCDKPRNQSSTAPPRIISRTTMNRTTIKP